MMISLNGFKVAILMRDIITIKYTKESKNNPPMKSFVNFEILGSLLEPARNHPFIQKYNISIWYMFSVFKGLRFLKKLFNILCVSSDIMLSIFRNYFHRYHCLMILFLRNNYIWKEILMIHAKFAIPTK